MRSETWEAIIVRYVRCLTLYRLRNVLRFVLLVQFQYQYRNANASNGNGCALQSAVVRRGSRGYHFSPNHDQL